MTLTMLTPIRQLAAEGLVSLALDKITGAGTKKLLGGFGWGDEFLEIVDKARGALPRGRSEPDRANRTGRLACRQNEVSANRGGRSKLTTHHRPAHH